jgi:hypothetical protein
MDFTVNTPDAFNFHTKLSGSSDRFASIRRWHRCSHTTHLAGVRMLLKPALEESVIGRNEWKHLSVALYYTKRNIDSPKTSLLAKSIPKI